MEEKIHPRTWKEKEIHPQVPFFNLKKITPEGGKTKNSPPNVAEKIAYEPNFLPPRNLMVRPGVSTLRLLLTP